MKSLQYKMLSDAEKELVLAARPKSSASWTRTISSICTRAFVGLATST